MRATAACLLLAVLGCSRPPAQSTQSQADARPIPRPVLTVVSQEGVDLIKLHRQWQEKMLKAYEMWQASLGTPAAADALRAHDNLQVEREAEYAKRFREGQRVTANATVRKVVVRKEVNKRTDEVENHYAVVLNFTDNPDPDEQPGAVFPQEDCVTLLTDDPAAGKLEVGKRITVRGKLAGYQVLSWQREGRAENKFRIAFTFTDPLEIAGD